MAGDDAADGEAHGASPLVAPWWCGEDHSPDGCDCNGLTSRLRSDQARSKLAFLLGWRLHCPGRVARGPDLCRICGAQLFGNRARKREGHMALSLRDVRRDPVANRALEELMHHYTVAEEKSRLVLTKKAGT